MHGPHQVLSINLGQLREMPFAGRMITTGFFKKPVLGPVNAGPLGFEGDVQADLTVHGGTDKAVYVYPMEHYKGWEALLEQTTLPPGSFGENLTTQGLTESQVYIGDVFQVGDALLQVTQPRSPCFKLQIRFGRLDAVALFVKQGHPGWYMAVLQAGMVRKNDCLHRVTRMQDAVSIADVWDYCFTRSASKDELKQIDSLKLLPSFWKDRVFREA
jgi:MOSC domain-containing protein YiiM